MKTTRHYHRKWRIWNNKIQALKKIAPLMLAVLLSKNVIAQDTLNNAAFRLNKKVFNPEREHTFLSFIYTNLVPIDFDNDGDIDIVGRGDRSNYNQNLDISLFFIENKGTINIPHYEFEANDVGYGFQNSNPVFLQSNLEKIKEIKSYQTNDSQTQDENNWNDSSAIYFSDFIFKDINSDDKIDLITLQYNYYSNKDYDLIVSFYENIGSKNAPIFDTLPLLQKTYSLDSDSLPNFKYQLMVCDIDLDGTDEIIAGINIENLYDYYTNTYKPNFKIVFLENLGTKTGDFLQLDPTNLNINEQQQYSKFTFTDLNGDNIIDIGVSFQTYRFDTYEHIQKCISFINNDGVLKNDSNYNFSLNLGNIEDKSPYKGVFVYDFLMGDLDNDSDQDIVLLAQKYEYCHYCYSDPFFSFYENNGKIGLGSGKISYDFNNDGIASINEQALANDLYLQPKITTENNTQFANPYFNLFLDIGTNTVTPSLDNFSFTPLNYSIDFDGKAPLNIDTLNFLAVFDTSKIDYAIDIANASAFRPGFAAYQNITINGISPYPKTGLVSYHLDEHLILLNANPPFTTEENGNYIWQIDSIGTKKNNISLSLQVKSSTPISTYIISNCQLEILNFDEKNLVNNKDSVFQVVTGSFDPNDKVCNFDPTIEPSNQPFEYTIRFQNTGNDTAFNILVIDTISNNFDLSTFKMLQSSHPYTVDFDKNRTAKFYFYNILLPDSTTNESASHGYVKYSIQAKADAGIGTEFTNKANIYFDFNTPIVTNQTRNVFGIISGINNHQNQSDIASKAYPNPTKSKLLIEFNNPDRQEVIISFYDISGKQVSAQNIYDNFYAFDTKDLPNGLYLYTIESANAFGKGKFVKE